MKNNASRRVMIIILLSTVCLMAAANPQPAKALKPAPAGIEAKNAPTLAEAALLSEGFEGGLVPPAGWSEVVSDRSYNWEIATSGIPHAGNYFANVEFDDKPQDEWLLSPALNLTQATLTFWSFGSLYWCRDNNDYCDLKVWIVVGEPGGGDDISLGKADSVWSSSWSWAQSTFNLTPVLPGGSVRIGFEYVGNNGAQIALDDIRLEVLDSNPVPTTTGLNPSSATAGGAAFPLTVIGSNFVPGSSVRWNGSNRSTSYVSGTQLTAAITAADIAAPGTVSVTVFNGTPGGGTSNAQTFTIINNNPVPTTTSLNPNSATAGGAAFSLTVNGTNFVSGSSVRWNGSNRSTSYVSSTKLTAAIPAADIAAPGTASVTVFNGTPGGGTSNPQTFTIHNHMVFLALILNKSGTLCNGGFEQGAACWTTFSSNGWNLITNNDWPAGISPHSGTWLAWLGGDADEISYIQQKVTVPAGSPYLAYYHWIDSTDACGNDYAKVIANANTVLEAYDLCSSQNTGGWAKHTVNLGALAGQSIQLRIQVQTNSANNSQLFLDDASFQVSAAGP